MLAALIAAIGVSPAAAQLAASVSVSSDDRFRGRSLSNGQPVSTADLSYDFSSGFYLGGSATGVATAHSGVEFLGSQQFAGYARRIGAGKTLDIGVSNSTYSHYFSGGYNADYTEIYAGLITSHLSGHIRYSPDYFRRSVSTVYADLDGVTEVFDTIRLNAHVGLIDQVGGPMLSHARRTHFDWRLGASKQFGHFDFHVAWTGAAPQPDYYEGSPHGRTALVGGATFTF